MRQDECLKQKKKIKNSTCINVGTLASLAYQKKLLLTRKTKVPASCIRSSEEGEHLQNLVEDHQILTETTTPATEILEEEMQLNSTVDEQEQCELQGSSAQKRKREKIKMLSVHGRHDRK